MSGKKVLCTGSQGFILSYLCTELLENGYEVIGIDNYSKYGRVKRPHDSHYNFNLVELDLESLYSYEILYNLYDCNFDFIIHGAAKIGGISYFHKYAYDLVASNERITDNVLSSLIQWHKDSKKDFPRFIYLSSSMVYESATAFPCKESDTDTIAMPRSAYGFQKLMGEVWVKAAHEQYGLPYTIIRPFNAVGIGEEDDFTKIKNGESCSLSHVLPDFVYKALIKQRPFKILGNGRQTRCLTNCKDIAKGIRLALESEQAICKIYNISSPRSIDMLALAYKVWLTVNPLDSFEYQFVDGFECDVQKRIPCTEKAEKELGFMANTSLSQSVREVIDFIRGKI